MGYMKNICIGAAVVGSAFAGYFLYKKLAKLYQDETTSTPSMTEEDANQVNGNDAICDTDMCSSSVQESGAICSHKVNSSKRVKTAPKSGPAVKKPSTKAETGYMGLRKGFLL